MSTREICDISFKKGIFLFEGGVRNEGMIVPHYNIALAKIEYFFIPSGNIAEYNNAKIKNPFDASRYYGNLIPDGALQHAAV
jgi:hypothetical protein